MENDYYDSPAPGTSTGDTIITRTRSGRVAIRRRLFEALV